MDRSQEFIKNSLKLDGFSDEIPIELIEYVPMHESRVASHEHPLLYTSDLQCCIALYAYAPNFGFMAHINTIGLFTGCNPMLKETLLSRQVIYAGIQELIKQLQEKGISAFWAPDKRAPEVILDTRDGTVITPPRAIDDNSELHEK